MRNPQRFTDLRETLGDLISTGSQIESAEEVISSYRKGRVESTLHPGIEVDSWMSHGDYTVKMRPKDMRAFKKQLERARKLTALIDAEEAWSRDV